MTELRPRKGTLGTGFRCGRSPSTDRAGRGFSDSGSPHDAASSGASATRRIVVDFQDGFADDTVRLTCGAADPWSKEGVTTDAMLGLAESAELEVPQSEALLSVSVPTRAIEAALPLPVNQPVTYVGVSISGGAVDFIVLEEPFGYA
jgi:hypothetical protein